jgi:polar amino acid transport system substrate-binding protein
MPAPIAKPAPRRSVFPPLVRLVGALLLIAGLAPGSLRADTLAKIRATGKLVYGADQEGGGPYVYPDPSSPRKVTGFEVELIEELAGDLAARAELAQGAWDRLLQLLDTNRIDLVINGYEWTPRRAQEYLATRPYYVYQLQLMAPRGSAIRSRAELQRPHPQGRRWRVGVLAGSAADAYIRESPGSVVEAVSFDGATDAMTAASQNQIDATLQDLPAALFYRDRYPKLDWIGPPQSHGYYVIYVRREDQSLRDALNDSLDRLIASGKLRRLYERYGIWNDAQRELEKTDGSSLTVESTESVRGWRLIRQYSVLLLDAAAMTILLSVTSMPLAMALGLMIALGRLFGPWPLRILLAGYVELLRGTPLMLQLYVLFYVLKLPALAAGIGGLAINYSAYEAEIYRAGLQAIPAGQMEAALALGMSRRLALRRVIVPQAVRIVIPPVTNDFIALFKDTSVCSVITLVELTKQYSILANSTGGVVEFAVATAVLYLAMSVPLSWLSRWSERRGRGEQPQGGGGLP